MKAGVQVDLVAGVVNGLLKQAGVNVAGQTYTNAIGVKLLEDAADDRAAAGEKNPSAEEVALADKIWGNHVAGVMALSQINHNAVVKAQTQKEGRHV